MPSSAHHRGRSSGIVDGNLPYWEQTCYGEHQLDAAGRKTSRQFIPLGISHIGLVLKAVHAAGKDTKPSELYQFNG